MPYPLPATATPNLARENPPGIAKTDPSLGWGCVTPVRYNYRASPETPAWRGISSYLTTTTDVITLVQPRYI